MEINFSDTKKITWPVYPLPSDNWSSQDGLLRLDGQLLDDKNMPGTSLGARRLQTPFKDQVQLKKSIISLVGILKNTSPAFIDNAGKVFKYRKTILCPLKFFEIKEILLKDTASVLTVHGIPNKFTIPRPPPDTAKYAGILYLGSFPWLLYEYSEVKNPDTRRKV